MGEKITVCPEFGLVNSTIQTICKNRTKIIRVFEQNGYGVLLFRKTDQIDVSEELLKYFQQERSDKYSSSEWPKSHLSFVLPRI
jgi:hypothetical protein